MKNIICYFLVLLLLLVLLSFFYKEYFEEVSNKPEFILYFTAKNHTPLNLYFGALEKILKTHNYNYKFIENIENIELKDNTHFVVSIIDNINDDLMDFLIKNKVKTIIINTEHHATWNVINVCDKLNKDTKLYLLDYNSINIKDLKNKYNISYVPLLYDESLIETYNSHVPNKTELSNKDIDIFVYGNWSYSDRRNKLIESLSKKYNVTRVHTIKFDELCKYLDRSKIVLNVYQYDFNKPFDYYRMSFLLSNKIFTISEYPSDIDLSIEVAMEDYDKYLILSSYDDMENTVSKYLDNWNPEEINNILNNQIEWFSKKRMESYVLKLIENL